MKILFSSYVFDPSVGGLESVSKVLATKFAEAGNKVHVITETAGGNIGDANYSLTRRPGLIELMRLLRWSDVFFQNNVSLQSLIPALFSRKPTLIVHQTWLQNASGRVGWQNRVKQALLPFATNVAISRAVASHLNAPSRVIGNPYDNGNFRLLQEPARDRTIAFLGRLVSDKGADVLLRAISLLSADGLRPDVAVIGKGPEEQNLRELSRNLGLDGQLTFAGEITGPALAEYLNHYRFLVIPSRWPEPFGVVALEGIACGCVIVGSEAGGLKEAIGGCGVTFQNGNAQELAKRLKDLLLNQAMEAKLREPASEHLKRFQADEVAAAYLDVIRRMVT